MTYTFEVPLELLSDMAQIRAVNGAPIRRQIITSLRIWVQKHRRDR
jgi:hypothetical protein